MCMCVGGMHSILLMPLVARCLETIDVLYVYGTCWFYVCCSDCMGVSVGIFVV